MDSTRDLPRNDNIKTASGIGDQSNRQSAEYGIDINSDDGYTVNKSSKKHRTNEYFYDAPALIRDPTLKMNKRTRFDTYNVYVCFLLGM